MPPPKSIINRFLVVNAGMATKFTASAPGQIFFFGEHSVVYGKPAIGAAIGLRTSVTAENPNGNNNLIRIKSENFGSFEGTVCEDGSIKTKREGDFGKLMYSVRTVEHFFRRFGVSDGVTLSISSQVPTKSGMSSSTALLVSELAALGAAFGVGIKKEEFFELAIPIQKEIHGGRASGTELIPSIYGGFVEVVSGKPTPLKMDTKAADLVIGDTGIPMSTAVMVKQVAALKARHPAILDKIFDDMALVAEDGKRALMAGDLKKVGELMNVNQGLLSAIGVSGPELESLIFAARSAGALGAKLSGGGGGKCMVALCPPGRKTQVANAINRTGGRAIITEIGAPGLEVKAVQ